MPQPTENVRLPVTKPPPRVRCTNCGHIQTPHGACTECGNVTLAPASDGGGG